MKNQSLETPTQGRVMDINIKNCNNIDEAKLVIKKGILNIKFAPNGTGKSTIAKAISDSESSENLRNLLPFKLRKENPNSLISEITFSEHIGNVMCFNEAYVNQFTFQSDELISDSFNIFIRTEAYIFTEKEIEGIVNDIKKLFTDDNRVLETLIADLSELGSAFKLTKTGISKASKGMKGLASGNKIKHIPGGLQVYKPFIQSSNNINWIDWQTKGVKDFSELSNCCPFCSTNIQDKKELIKKVSTEYDKTMIKNLMGIITVIGKLGDYFSADTKAKLDVVTSSPDGLKVEHEIFLITIKNQIDNFQLKLQKLRILTGFDFKKNETVNIQLEEYKLDLQFFSTLDSEKTRTEINLINESIDQVLSQAGRLQGKLNRQRLSMQELIQKHQDDINNFLEYAGYKYEVKITGEDDKCQLKLLHVDYEESISEGDQHLSFGERNAFAIVLFMYECLAKNPDLIILDDPISSFDKNKKYAILEMLFKRKSKNCLKDNTVLMLTHDIEPIIDTIKAVSKKFNNQVNASYLRYSQGTISEQTISKNDIKTFTQICNSILKKDCDVILKLIYLRRYYEVLDDKEDAYQVLSNLLHPTEKPCDKREPRGENGYPELEQCKFESGCSTIEEKILDFNHDCIFHRLKDLKAIKTLYDNCSNGYEKLQIFRLLKSNTVDSVIRKFINETYHIENEYICQLDPTEFDLIPEYIIQKCGQYVTES